MGYPCSLSEKKTQNIGSFNFDLIHFFSSDFFYPSFYAQTLAATSSFYPEQG
jgi:hypothetical protein